MTPNLWIENSRKVYALLLNLYPKEHRADYGYAMQQVFTDLCRSAYQKKGALGMCFLWLRTLPDLGSTILLEHFASPRASWGLMEPVPNAPLPWKGVFLVLLPGLVYLVSQIAQLTGQPWYMTVYYRAAFLLIIPVLAVWGLTRRFPIWGLIPVGLLYRLVQEIGYQWLMMGGYVITSNSTLAAIYKASDLFHQELIIPTLLLFVALLLLAWRYLRLQKPARSFWLWMGVYVLVSIFSLTNTALWIAEGYQEASANGEIWYALKGSVYWSLFNFTAFLLLIFIGTLFTRRHGFFAILIPMGYILPAIVVGMPWSLENVINPELKMALISFAVLAYRALLALIAPIWMSRTGSTSSKTRAVLVSIAIALGIHAVLQFHSILLYPEQRLTAQWIFDVAFEEMKLISAILLGIAMYQNTALATGSTGDGDEKYAKLFAEKA